MKPKNNRILAARFRAQRLMQTIIAEGIYTPSGRRLFYKLHPLMNKFNLSLADLGMTERQDSSSKHGIS